MALGIFFKLLSDLCFYLALPMAIIGVLDLTDYRIWIGLILTAMAGGIKEALWKWSPGLGKGIGVALVILGGVLMFSPNLRFLLLLPISVYGLFMALYGSERIEYYDSKKFFIWLLLILGGLLLLEIGFKQFHLTEYTDIDAIDAMYNDAVDSTEVIITDVKDLGYNTEASFACYFLGFFFGSIALKILRFRGDLNPGRVLCQLSESFAVPLAIVGLSGLFYVLRQYFALIFLAVPMAFASWFMGLASGAGKIKSQSFGEYLEAQKEIMANQDVRSSIGKTVQEVHEETAPASSSADKWPMMSIMIAILIVILIIVFVLLIRRIRGEATVKMVTRVKNGETEKTPKRKLSFFARLSNRERVRKCYQQLLEICGNKGIHLSRDLTSEEIEAELIKFVEEDLAKELRMIYLFARYYESGQVTDEQVRAAEAAIRKLK